MSTNTEKCDRIVAESGVRLGFGKWAPKMTLHQRCQALAIGMRYPDLSRTAVAEYFGVHKTNMAHLWNRYSRNYRPVHRLAEEMGRNDFIEEYLDAEIVAAVLAIQQNRRPPPPKLPNVNRDKYEGQHTLQPSGAVILVRWLDAFEGVEGPRASGWYGIERDDPDIPSGPFNTSAAAYDYMKENLS